jgi:hypothetical protein
MNKKTMAIKTQISNMSTIKTDLTDVYVDRIAGIDENGDEILILQVGEIINKSITCMYDKKISSLIIYYIHAETDINFELYSSYSKYVSFGTVELPILDIGNNEYIKPIVDVQNIGDAHISMKLNVQLYDENVKAISGYELYIPITSDSVYFSNEIGNRYSSRYAYIDNEKITDEELIVSRKDIEIFAIPINDHDHIKYENGIVHISGINYHGAYISGIIYIYNTNYTKLNHTPVIRNISMAIYK